MYAHFNQTADAASLTQHIVTSANISHPLMQQITLFYKITPGAERLLGKRALQLAYDIKSGKASAAIVMTPQGRIVACAAGYDHGGDVYEIGSVLVHPNYKGHGLYPAMRALHEQHAAGKTMTLFERITDKIIQERTKEGWAVMDSNDPVYAAIEAKKALSGFVSGEDWPPKTAFKKAAIGTGFALILNDGAHIARNAAPTPAIPG